MPKPNAWGVRVRPYYGLRTMNQEASDFSQECVTLTRKTQIRFK